MDTYSTTSWSRNTKDIVLPLITYAWPNSLNFDVTFPYPLYRLSPEALRIRTAYLRMQTWSLNCSFSDSAPYHHLQFIILICKGMTCLSTAENQAEKEWISSHAKWQLFKESFYLMWSENIFFMRNMWSICVLIFESPQFTRISLGCFVRAWKIAPCDFFDVS